MGSATTAFALNKSEIATYPSLADLDSPKVNSDILSLLVTQHAMVVFRSMHACCDKTGSRTLTLSADWEIANFNSNTLPLSM